MSAYIQTGSDSPPVGAIMDFAGISEPPGWLFCYGQSLDRTAFAALFAALGTTYGAVDGTHFSIPDLRGRVAAGVDDMGGTRADRLSFATVGNTTNGSTSLTSVNANWRNSACIGWFIYGTGIAVGATLASSASPYTTLVMSAAATATATSVSIRLSPLDSLALGAKGGKPHQLMLDSEMPNHTHPTGIVAAGSGIGPGSSYIWTTGTTSPAGSDFSHNNTQPSLLLNKIIKY